MVRIVTGPPPHRLEDPVEVLALKRQQLLQRFPAVDLRVGQNHALHNREPAFPEEHVLGPAQPDATRAERIGDFRLVGLVGVGAHTEAPHAVRPLHHT